MPGDVRKRAAQQILAQHDEVELAARMFESASGVGRPEGATAATWLASVDAEMRSFRRIRSQSGSIKQAFAITSCGNAPSDPSQSSSLVADAFRHRSEPPWDSLAGASIWPCIHQA